MQNGNLGTRCEIALRWMVQILSNEKSTLIQVKACCLKATSHYLNQCWPRSMLSYSITRPWWVNPKPWSCWIYFSKQNLFEFPIISQHWVSMSSWNQYSKKTKTHLSCIFNTVVADVLTMQGTRTSAAMILILLSWTILVPAPDGLMHWVWTKWLPFCRWHFQCLFL